ncbi:MAG: hypothetical protein EZS28_043883, partial [Streblomastix strix]
FNLSLSWPGLLANYLATSLIFVEDTKIQYFEQYVNLNSDVQKQRDLSQEYRALPTLLLLCVVLYVQMFQLSSALLIDNIVVRQAICDLADVIELFYLDWKTITSYVDSIFRESSHLHTSYQQVSSYVCDRSRRKAPTLPGGSF